MRLPLVYGASMFRIATLTIALSLTGCATLNDMLGSAFVQPKLHYKTMRLSGLSFEGATLDFDFELENPNAVAISLASLDYKLNVEGKQLFAGDQNKGIKIGANARSPVTLPFSVKFVDLAQSLATLFSSKQAVPYDLAVGFGLKTPIGPIRLPAKVDGTVPLPKLPEVKVANVRMGNLSVTGAEVIFDLNVQNKSKFPLRLEGLNYGVEIAGAQVGSGNAQVPAMAANAAATTQVPIRLNFLSVGAAVVNVVRSKQVPYKFTGKLDLGPFDHPFTLAGNAKL